MPRPRRTIHHDQGVTPQADLAVAGLLHHAAQRPAAARVAGLRNARAFTLTELLVVVFIIVIVIAAGIPVVRAMSRDARLAGGVNTVGVAVETARRHAAQPYNNIEPPVGARHRGGAAIFSPSGEIRITLHRQNAIDGNGNYLEEKPIPWVGFADIAGLDYVQLPARVRVQGIIRRDNGGASVLEFFDPPFAVRFDESGRLIVNGSQGASPDSIDRLVFYDHNHNGRYTNSPRPAGYTIANFNAATAWDAAAQKHQLPFGRLEAVIGVRVIDLDNPGRHEDIFFSRYSGAPIRR